MMRRRDARQEAEALVGRPGASRLVIVGTVLVSVITLGLAGCSHASTGFGRLTVDGQVQVAPPGGAPRSAGSGAILRAGDRVQVTAGQVAIRLPSGGVLELRAGSQITIGKTPRLTSGAVLIQPNNVALQVSAQTATVVVPSGGAQLAVGSIATGLVVKVYQATSFLDIVGNPPSPIVAPRQVSLTPETRLPVQALPLQYLDTDPWDRLYLAEAATISTQLAAAAAGFNAQVPANAGTSAGFYEQLLPSLNGQPDFQSAFDQVRSQQPAGPLAAKPGDYLIAAVIALRGKHGTFSTRLNNELVFAAQGAPWGFVAYDQGVTDLSGVLNDVLAAIGRASLPLTGAPASQIAIGPPPSAGTPPTTRPARPPATTPTTTTPTNPRQPHQSTTTSTTTLPLLHLPVPLLPGPLGSILDPLLDPLIQALNNILSGKG